MSNDYIIVPVLSSFGDQEPIGELRVLTSRLPPCPLFHFALAYTTQHLDSDHTDYKLVSVAITPSHLFKA